MSMPDARNTRVAVTRPAATDLLVRIRADGRVLLPLTGARRPLPERRRPGWRFSGPSLTRGGAERH